MRPATVPLVTILWIGTAAVGAGAIGSEPPDDAKTAESEPAASPDPAAKEAKNLKLPPGFATKKRGKYVLYCRRDATLGSRIKTEKCFDEGQMRDYLIALEETKGNVDRIRSVCSNPCACGQIC